MAGLAGRFYRVIESMFSQATFAVKFNQNERTMERPYTSGVFQGDNLSPKLHNFFIRDITDYLMQCNHHAPTLNGKPVPALLYCDTTSLSALNQRWVYS